MSFNPPEGILDIGNATLRVGKLEVSETLGLNQGLQNIVKNNLLITETTSYTTNQKWGLKLPTTWVAEFEVKGHTGKYIDFNFYNENSASNALGYNLTFKDTTMTLRYDGGSALGGGAATIPTIVGAFRKVNIFFERGVIAVSIDGTRYLYFRETDGYNNGVGAASRVVSATGGAFVNLFIEANATDSAFKNLRIVNDRFISDKTSNIAFVGGNLGVGVNSPQEALDIRGNMHFERVSNVSQIKVSSNVVAEYTGPHDRPLRKYPEVLMTGATTGGYTASQSSEYDASGSYNAWKAFDSDERPNGTLAITQSSQYNNLSGTLVYAGNKDLLGDSNYKGEWIKLELPVPVAIQKIHLQPRSAFYQQTPHNFKIVGSNDDSSWDILYHNITAANYTITSDTEQVYHMTNNLANYYKYVAIVANTLGVPASGNYQTMSLADWDIYGHEEGDSSLDTTLKSVYNVPGTQQLEVYYDAKNYTSGTITDESPNSYVGTLNSVTIDNSAIQSFDIPDGGNISATLTSIPSADFVHSVSVWVKFEGDTLTTSYPYLYFLGATSPYSGFALYYAGASNPNKLHVSCWTLDYPINFTFSNDTWHHVTYTYSGGGWNRNSTLNAYVDGIEYSLGVNRSSGTEGTAPTLTTSNVPLRIGTTSTGGAFDGKIANFRLFSKALNADQVRELYDYQKDYFLGTRSSVTLYKGHLGIGVAEPSGQLELAGDERLQQYPPRGLGGDPLVFDPAGSAYGYNVEGHGVFKVSTSLLYHASTSDDRRIHRFFDHNDSTFTHWNAFNGSSPYEATTNAQITTLDGGSTITAHFAEIQMPYKITLKKYNLRSSSQLPRALKTGMIVGSNDGNVYHVLHNVPDFGFTSTYQTREYTVDNTTTPYRFFRLLLMNTVGNATCNMNEWSLFGTPGPTTLDKGSLTLGRSLDVPRISRYDVDTETPRPEKLVVDFDTTVNSSPTDISGQGNHGVFVNGASYSAPNKAFSFDGGNDYIEGNINNSGDIDITVSFWVRRDGDGGLSPSSGGATAFFFLGNEVNGQGIGIDAYNSGALYLYMYGGHVLLDANGTPDFFPTGKWVHVVASRKMGTPTDGVTFKFYVNGEDVTSNFTFSNGAGNALTLPSNAPFQLGYRTNGTTSLFHMDGKISNFKLYNVALEASEVQKLYRLGRTGRSMVISDTAVGIGKVPEAQLDVRGNLNVDGVITNQQKPVFYAYTPGGAAFGDGVTGAIPFTTTRINVGNCFNTSDYKFYAPITGYYWFRLQILGRQNGADGNIETTLHKNGVDVSSRNLAYTQLTGSGDHDNLGFDFPLFCNAGDTVHPVVGTCAAGVNVYYGEDLGHFSGYFLG